MWSTSFNLFALRQRSAGQPTWSDLGRLHCPLCWWWRLPLPNWPAGLQQHQGGAFKPTPSLLPFHLYLNLRFIPGKQSLCPLNLRTSVNQFSGRVSALGLVDCDFILFYFFPGWFIPRTIKMVPTASWLENHYHNYPKPPQAIGQMTWTWTFQMTEEALIYSFSLRYEPKAIGSTAILKTNPAETVVECQYPR